MTLALLGRLGRMLLVLLGASLLTFALLRLAPGDPVALMLGPVEQATGSAAEQDARMARLRGELGLDQPPPLQFARWLGRLARLDLGVSFRTRQPVAAELGRRLPATALLAAAAFAIELALALGGGVLAALWAGRWPDQLLRALAVTLAALPGFVLAWLLLRFFAADLGWYALSGPPTLARLTLPAVTLGALGAPALMRVIRAGLLAERERLYIEFARAKGAGPLRLVLGHALRNTLLPTVALLGMSLAGLLSGAVVIETIFSWPGIGRYAVESILARDYPVIQGYVLLITALVIAINGLSDLVSAALDPRLRGRQEAIA